MLKYVSLSCMFHLLLTCYSTVNVSASFLFICAECEYSVCVYVQPSSASNIERNDTLWSRTWIAHWFLGASLTIHSNWFLALLGVRVMAVLMYHLYVYSSPTATGFTIVRKMHIQHHVQMWDRDFIHLCSSSIIYSHKYINP